MVKVRHISLSSTILFFLLVSPFFVGIVPVNAAPISLPDDATPLQRAIYEALQAGKEANETVPDAEYLSYGNGTTLTTLTYKNGTQRSFIETFKIKNVTIRISPDTPLFLPINTTDKEATEYSTKIQDILMGFTFEIPRYDWSLEIRDPLFGILLASGGIIIDIGFGIRLPVQIKLEYPEIMVTNRLYTLYASVGGLDWTAADFADAGLLPNENEFLCKFYFRAWLSALGSTIFDFEIDFDESTSFSTPLGPGESFPLPRISVPLNQIIEQIIKIPIGWFVNFELEIDPRLGSQKVTSNWKVENGAIGEGSFLWSYNNERLSFDIRTLDTITVAEITLTKFRYWFTVFVLDFSLFVDFRGIISWLGDHEILLYTLDLSELLGSLDLYVGVHEYTIGTVYVRFLVIPIAPLGTISLILAMIGALGLFVGLQHPRAGKKARNERLAKNSMRKHE